MRIGLWKTLTYSNSILGALLSVMFLGSIATGAMLAIEYVVNTQRSTDHWVEYHDVRPTQEQYAVGTFPVFISQSTWHQDIEVSWNDIMWCEATSGPNAGKLRRLMSYTTGYWEYHLAGHVGIKGAANGFKSDEEPASGFWQWNGPLPIAPALCWLEPRVAIRPSPGVVRNVRIRPTMTFVFK